jgi:pimeloyl-[acyl-carrier protein] methyl ester esterase
MHVETRGQGPDLVMLHGWSMHSGVWLQLAESLSQRYTLHLVDLPGHGRSDWQEDGFELDRLVAELSGQLPERAVWMGWSLGGLVSLAMAAQMPQRVNSLILMAATPRFVKTEDWPCAMEPEVFENFAANLDVDQQQTLQRFLLLQARGARQSKDTIRSLAASLACRHSPTPEALHAGLDLLLQVDMRRALAGLSCPVQLLLGEKDTLIPQTMPGYARKLNSRLRTEIIAGAGHAPFISYADRCCKLIEQFIDD